MNTLLIKSTLATAIALSIAACTPADNEGVAGIGGSGYVSSGSVTGFGSVFVNGVEFETDSSTFDVDGVQGTQDDLAIGMIVQVSGSINADGITGNATSIRYDDQLQGPVTGPITYDADRVTATFTVIGVKVIIDSGSTSFDGTSFDSITINNNVEISGFFDSSGNLVATRVELKDITFDPANSIVEAKGTITGLDNSTFKFAENLNLTIDASEPTSVDDLPNGLVDGQLVEVKGTYNAGTNTIKATGIEAEDDSVDDTDEFEVEGLINNYDAINSTFTINGIDVNASGATLEPATLILENDIRIEVEGAIVNGVLVATKIESEGGDIKVHAMVTAVPPATAANTFEVTPVAGQPAITVTVTTSTQLEDDVNEIKNFTLDNLDVNNFVEVRGFDDGNGGITAVEIDVKKPGDVIVQGNATAALGSALTGGTMTIFGVTFDFDNGATTDFEKDSDIEGQPDVTLTTTEIDNLINAINNVGPQLVKIGDDEVLNGIGDGLADEIEIE